MLKKILLVVVAVLVVLALVIQTRSDEYRVSRSIAVSAPAAVAYGQVSDFHRWDAWSPWAKLDPAMKTDHTGPAAGPGSSYHWVGNDKVGEGRMTITGARPASEVVIKLEFVKPWAGLATTTFGFVPDGGGTRVSWTMVGKNNFIGKAMCLVMDMDKMVGGDFERGLAALKAVAEAEAQKALAAAPPVPAAAK